MDAAPNQQRETFASYLARYYIAKKGYSASVPPEAASLADACDIVLAGMDSISFELICIVDCEASPDKQFAWPADVIREIGRQCLKYSGSIGFGKFPVSIRIYEIGPGIDDESRRARLAQLRKLVGKVYITAWTLDTTSGSVWTNTPLRGRFRGRPLLEQLLGNERIPDTEFQAWTSVPEPSTGKPYVTYGLLAILTALFACEMFLAIDRDTSKFDPGIGTLIAMGGSSGILTVQQGEWYRGISAVFLHSGVLHFLLNAAVLFWAGRKLEPLIGHAWFGAIYAVAAVCGSLLSLAVNPPNIISVGASGAIMGIMAAAFVCSFRFTRGSTRTELQLLSVQVLIPSLLPLTSTVSGGKVDFAAHLGGAIGGALVGALMLVVWSRDAALPSLQKLAATVAAVWTAGALYAGVVLGPAFGKARHEQSLRAFLIPDDRLRDSSTILARADVLVTQFPRDPRAYYFRALKALETGNLAEAEKDLRTALAEKEILTTVMKSTFHDSIQGVLALTLAEQGKTAEAKATAKPVCGRYKGWSDATREMFARLCN